MKVVTECIKILPTANGYGYFVRGKCFAFAWAWKPGSPAWWANLAFMADIHPQTMAKWKSERERKKRRAKPEQTENDPD